METTNIKISLLSPNDGQIDGLPKNPRFIRDERFEKLKKSIEELPEMLELRELIVIPFNNRFVIIGGNMRFRAMKDIGFKEAPCKVLEATTPAHILRQISIKDNVAFGNDDTEALANDWDQNELKDWGMEFPSFDDFEEEEKEHIEKPDEDNMIAVTLTDEEKESWLSAKEHIGIKNDKKAIFRLIEFMYQTENEE
ncbi:MAG: ParB N-terminal domain-containing protein [Soonwooa sp.]